MNPPATSVSSTFLEAVRDEIISFLRLHAKSMVDSSTIATRSKAGDVDGDVVTNVDYALQSLLKDFLPPLVKNSIFIGEEDFAGIPDVDEAPLWIVDPLDGTLNFASGIPLYSLSICLVVASKPSLAIVFDLVHDVVYDAIAGKGARVDTVGLTWKADIADRASTAITSGVLSRHLVGANGKNGEALWEMLGPKCRILGSQALQLCWVAAGRLKLNVSVETKLWDEAAGILICKEAGAAHVTVGGEDVFPLRAGGAAATGKSLTTVAGAPELVRRAAAFLEGISKQ